MCGLVGHNDTVTDCQWAPQFGRSFHMIASCSLDRTIKIWKVDLQYDINNEQFENVTIKTSCIGDFEHTNQVSL
jgi:WD40 repeat protein